MGEGLTTELGGEFIDSTHEALLSLIAEFGLELIDTRDPAERDFTDAYYFGGRFWDDAEILDALVPIVTRMREDLAALPESIDFATRSPKAVELDRVSLKDYLRRVGATGYLGDLLAIAYTTEFGLDAEEQSALNLLTLFDPSGWKGAAEGATRFEPYGESDERFKVRGGNQQVVDELARRAESQVHLEHRLESVSPRGDGVALSFARASGGSIEAHADMVLLTVPFTTLRKVELRIDLPDVKRKAIAELGYGQGAKLLMPFRERIWRDAGRSGNFFTDSGPQSGWDNSRGQPGTAGGLTIFTGGRKSEELARDPAYVAAIRALTPLMKIFPNANVAFTSRAEKFHWPTHPHILGSYACYRRGQWTSIAGAEGAAVGALHFAGEHCSRDFQGFMNGAVETGLSAAQAILDQMGVGVNGASG